MQQVAAAQLPAWRRQRRSAPTPIPTPTGSPTPCRPSPTSPCRPPQWDRYANLIGVDPAQVRWEDSTDEQRDELLDTAIRTLLNTTTPAAITTPPLIWWHGIVPDDTDNTWETTPVPGWNGTLGDYLAALVDDYATNPDHTWDDHQCIPPAATTCGQPAETAAILATIRHFESGDDYTQQSHAVAADGRNSGGNPTGAYQFLYTSWGGYGGYAEAFMAPPSVQDELATANVTTHPRRLRRRPCLGADRLVRRHRRRPQRPRRHLVNRLRPQPRLQPHLDRRLPSPLARPLHDDRPPRRRRHPHRLPARRPGRRRLGQRHRSAPPTQPPAATASATRRGPAAPSSATAATATASPPAPASTTAPASSSPPGGPPASTSSPNTASTAPKPSRTPRSRRSTRPPSSPATSPSTPSRPAASATSS